METLSGLLALCEGISDNRCIPPNKTQYTALLEFILAERAEQIIELPVLRKPVMYI